MESVYESSLVIFGIVLVFSIFGNFYRSVAISLLL